MSALTFMLPWPDSVLSPNRSNGSHWAVKAIAKNAAKLSVIEAMNNLRRPDYGDEGGIKLSLIFCRPDRRGYDLDNLHSAMKPSIDEIARQLGINDKRFYPQHQSWGDPIEGGAVVVAIGE